MSSCRHATRRLQASCSPIFWACAAAPLPRALFFAVYVNDGLTLDFIETNEPFPVQHLCFRVDEEDFDRILSKIQAAGIGYRSDVRGPFNQKINTDYGGKMIYWNEPEGHQWEILTVSYAREVV
jgi:catechol 2,3-dioxygenase-like lactoylglutathione lyase family enzyme